MIRVVVAEDHHLVREAVRVLLEQADDIEVVAEATDGREAIEAVARFLPDVLVIDITMPKMNGILATEEIRKRDLPTRVVILSIHSNVMFMRQALKAGAFGYVVKNSVSQELLKAIRFASAGKTYLNDEVAALSELDRETSAQRLTLREREILQLIVEGYSNRDMAELLSLSIKTIEKHRASLVEKLGVRDMPSLMQVALRMGLISLDDTTKP